MTSLELFRQTEHSPREHNEWGTGQPKEHRDLWVPRNATWTYTGEPGEQRYTLTQLKRSNIRSTDELVPRPQDSVMVKDLINLPFPAEHPYSSHIPRFAVFPKFDSPEDPKRGVAARSEVPINAEMPAQPYDIVVLKKTKGSGTRHVIQAQPKDSEREPLYWPGENFFDQQVKGHGERQQFYPFPPKGITPNLQSRPEEMKVSLRTANVLRNLERSHWMTSYDLDYTGLGPSNPLSLDNLDSKLTTKIMTRLDDDKLYPHFLNTFDPPRGMEGRLSRKITPAPAAQRVLESSKPENPGYKRKPTLNEREEYRLLRGTEYVNLPDTSSSPSQDMRWRELDLEARAGPCLEKIEKAKAKQFDVAFTPPGTPLPPEESNLIDSKSKRDEVIQEIEAYNRWKLLNMQAPDHNITALRNKYEALSDKELPDTFYNHGSRYNEERAGLYKTSYDPHLLALNLSASTPEIINTLHCHSQAQTLKAGQGSHLSKDLRESLKWSRNLSLSAPDLRSDHEGQEMLQAYKDLTHQQQRQLLPPAPHQASTQIQENDLLQNNSTMGKSYNTLKFLQENELDCCVRSDPKALMSSENKSLSRVRSRSVPRPSKNVQFSRSVTVATMSPNTIPVLSVETQPLSGEEAQDQDKTNTTQYTSTHAMYNASSNLNPKRGRGTHDIPTVFSSLPGKPAAVIRDKEDTQIFTNQSSLRSLKGQRPATSSGLYKTESRDQFGSLSTNFMPSNLTASTSFVSSYQNQFPVYNLTYKHDPRFDWEPGSGIPRPQTSLLHLQESFVKSDVRQKFHEQFPEINPDLRLNIIKGKKHSFGGFNAQVIRG